MRAGIFLAYWPWFTPSEQVELAVLADELGLDSVLATTPERLDDRLAAFAAAGVDTLVGVPCGSDRGRVVRALAEATR